MPKFERFEDIDAWKEGCRLSTQIYEITKGERFARDWGLRDQIRRAAVSIPSNIAEGFERDSPKEFVRFLRIAKGSAGELRTQLYIARSLEYLGTEEFQGLVNKVKHISRMISRLVSYIEGRENL
jgi:four helix bundle protein